MQRFRKCSKIRAMKKWIYRILIIILLGVAGFSGFHIYEVLSAKHQVEKETENYKKLVENDNKNTIEPDWDALKEQNPDIVGWIYVPGCDISFPVVQGEDNSYYLSHTTDKQDSQYGSVFLDSNANSQFLDNNSIIYGHSVEGGGMFTNIKDFADESFFNNHPYFYLLTPSANYKCKIMTFAKTTDSSVYYTTSFGDYRDSVISQWLSNALYTNTYDTSNCNFVSLSTCNLDYGFNSDQRYVLTAILDVTNDPIEKED